MLALVDTLLKAIRAARNDTDAADILARIALGLRFRSGYLIEYAPDLLTARHIIDSHPDRFSWWQSYLASAGRGSTEQIRERLGSGEIIRYDQAQFLPPSDPLLILAKRNDMAEVTIVPVTYDQMPVGVAGFSGLPELTPTEEAALRILVYSLFSQVTSFRNIGIAHGTEPLTPREKEVIGLSADGYTSDDIAEHLGMAARTVNQHVDNVARKLGTKNRTHTVAEAIRRNML
jgi:DNA-binding CsgD family transcriptional regulator